MKRKKLIARRKALKMTQSEVSEKSGLDRSYYTRIEIGTRTPSTASWQRIFKTLKIDESEMGGYLVESNN